MFVTPEVNVVKFEQIDVIATSGDNGGTNKPIVTPGEELD